MDLSKSTIVITGAARGLGAAMATRLATCGCRLALVDVDSDGLQARAASCREAGAPAAHHFVADVSSEEQVTDLFDAISRELGEIHGLVNNAGITRDGLMVKVKEGKLVAKMSLEQWQAVIDVNLTGVFLCAREAAGRMMQAGIQGCVVNISSISRHGNFGQTNYAASKAGVEAMAVVWAREWAGHGIRAASVAPGFIATDMVLAMKQEARDKIARAIPAGRVGNPDEIAATVQFILENDYINGRCIDVDGGLRI